MVSLLTELHKGCDTVATKVFAPNGAISTYEKNPIKIYLKKQKNCWVTPVIK